MKMVAKIPLAKMVNGTVGETLISQEQFQVTQNYFRSPFAISCPNLNTWKQASYADLRSWAIY